MDVLIWNPTNQPAEGTQPTSVLKLWTNTGRAKFNSNFPFSRALSSSDARTLDSFLNATAFRQSFVFDVNKDGLDDLVFINPSTKQVWGLIMSAVWIYGQSAILRELTPAAGLPSWFSAWSKVVVYDVDGDGDGDGSQDVVIGEGSHVAVYYQDNVNHNLLDTVTDGNGLRDTVYYTTGKQDYYYLDSLPQPELSKPVHLLPPTVVSHNRQADGMPSLMDTFAYADGRVGYYGRGFLGFTEIYKTVYTSDLGMVARKSLIFVQTP